MSKPPAVKTMQRMSTLESQMSSYSSGISQVSSREITDRITPTGKSPPPKQPQLHLQQIESKQADIRRSIRKINNLRFLGLLKTSDPKSTTAPVQLALPEDVETMKRTFKVNQKGLTFNTNEYYLQINAVVMNNHQRRQPSPSERSKVNLYDDEQHYLSQQQSHSLQPSNRAGTVDLINLQLSPPSSHAPQQNLSANLSNNNNNNLTKKRNGIRRRSCYCEMTGKQSTKGTRMDLLFPNSLIKNRIYMLLKKRQDQIASHQKDLIIQNLNKTFEVQQNSMNGHTATSNSNNNTTSSLNKKLKLSPQDQEATPSSSQHNNSNNNHYPLQHQRLSIPLQNQSSSMTPKASTQQQHQQQHQSNHLQQPRSHFFTPTSPKPQPARKDTSTFSQYMINEQSPDSNKHVQTSTNVKSQQQQPVIRTSLMISPSPFSSIQEVSETKSPSKPNYFLKVNYQADQPSSPSPSQSSSKSNLTLKASRVSMTASQKLSPSPYKRASFDPSRQMFNGAAPNASPLPDQPLSSFFDKRKKLIAKLRFASRLVGIHERQRKKSILYNADYYQALQHEQELGNPSTTDVNNGSAQECENQDTSNQRTGANMKSKAHQISDKMQQHNAQIVTQQIIDSNHLRFNTTIQDFLDYRSKSNPSLLSPKFEDLLRQQQQQLQSNRNAYLVSPASSLTSTSQSILRSRKHLGPHSSLATLLPDHTKKSTQQSSLKPFDSTQSLQSQSTVKKFGFKSQHEISVQSVFASSPSSDPTTKFASYYFNNNSNNPLLSLLTVPKKSVRRPETKSASKQQIKTSSAKAVTSSGGVSSSKSQLPDLYTSQVNSKSAFQSHQQNDVTQHPTKSSRILQKITVPSSSATGSARTIKTKWINNSHNNNNDRITTASKGTAITKQLSP